MKNILLVMAILIICSCQENKSENNKEYSLKKLMMGKWGGLGESTPVFQITMDSIFYFDKNKSYSYTMINNDFIINFPTNKGILKNVSVIKDTMFFFDDYPDTIRAFRFKE